MPEQCAFKEAPQRQRVGAVHANLASGGNFLCTCTPFIPDLLFRCFLNPLIGLRFEKKDEIRVNKAIKLGQGKRVSTDLLPKPNSECKMGSREWVICFFCWRVLSRGAPKASLLCACRPRTCSTQRPRSTPPNFPEERPVEATLFCETDVLEAILLLSPYPFLTQIT